MDRLTRAELEERAALRRALALLAALVWLLGFELGPNLHVGMHHLLAHHHHAGDRPRDEGHRHRADHGGHDTHDGHGTPGHDDVPDENEENAASDPTLSGAWARSFDHGRHALAHRGVAVHGTPPAFPVIAEAPLLAALERTQDEGRPTSGQPLTVRARGPPAGPLPIA